MSQIQLPPGMTADQYMATPEGQRAAQELAARFQAWMDAQQRRSGPAYRPGIDPPPYGRPMGDALPPPAYAPPSRPRQPVTRRDKAPLSPGRAQPKISSDMNATRLMDTTVSDLSAALAEMFPEMGVGERSMLSRELAEDYMRERREAASAIKQKTPVAPMTEQMEFDTAFSKISQERAREERMRKRMEEAMKKYNWDEPEKPARKPSRPMPSAGMAQPIAPSTRQPFSAPDQQQMYWELVNSGVPPAEAAQRVRDAFAYAPASQRPASNEYGRWVGSDPTKSYYTMDVQDRDGDGVDDRWQSGPGRPNQKPRPSGVPGTGGNQLAATAARLAQQAAERRKAQAQQNYENNPAAREMADRDREIQLGMRPAYTP